jgi:hypothetical protein
MKFYIELVKILTIIFASGFTVIGIMWLLIIFFANIL